MNIEENNLKELIHKVNKEYKEFREKCYEKGVEYVYKRALKVSFYKEIRTYIVNTDLKEEYYIQMLNMDKILETLWKRYKVNVIDKSGEHFLEQLLDVHFKNEERINYRNK